MAPLRPRKTPYHIVEREMMRCASQQYQAANVRFGSKADVTLLNLDVRFTPESGHGSAR
jgi:hypothetical protein